ncbi:MAG: hypothetical protein HY864_02005 [Chloroflexi bacterium]|nr:hypothetical protein [Chloroflexota bacterium]
MAKKKTAEEGAKPKIEQNVIIAIISAITTVAVAMIPFLMNRANSEPAPTLAPLVVTTTSAATLPTETVSAVPSETEAAALTSTPVPQIGIFNGFLAADIEGLLPKSSFKPDEAIYLLFEINDPTGKNVVRVVWSVVEAKGFKAGAVLSDTPYIINEKKYVIFSDHGVNPWAVGKYQVDLYLNNTLFQTIPFDIAR